MGMLLSTPMILIGLATMLYAYRRDVASGNRIGADALRSGARP
jgi:prolipoprotein diacylglyceryltransferase